MQIELLARFSVARARVRVASLGDEMKVFLAKRARKSRIITSVVSLSKSERASSISLRSLRISFSYISFSRSYLRRHSLIRFPMNCKFKANIFVISVRACLVLNFVDEIYFGQIT